MEGATLGAAVVKSVRTVVPGMPGRYQLSQTGEAFYDWLPAECCACLVQLETTLPAFQAGVLTELLRRDSTTIDLLRQALARLPDRREVGDFEADYCQQVVNALDRMELFGASVSKASRRYPLSVAYLSLRISGLGNRQRADTAVDGSARLLVRGEAGSGKTTPLQWIAVRRAGEMPTSRVQDALRPGQAVVLVDGVDELPERRRSEVRRWLEQLVALFPDAHYIVTSRPAAIEADWLEDLGFSVAELQPMTPADTHAFVHRSGRSRSTSRRRRPSKPTTSACWSTTHISSSGARSW